MVSSLVFEVGDRPLFCGYLLYGYFLEPQDGSLQPLNTAIPTQ